MPVPLRTDFDAHALRAIACTTKDGPQARRLLALAAIYEGATRTAAARLGGVTVQIVRGGGGVGWGGGGGGCVGPPRPAGGVTPTPPAPPPPPQKTSPTRIARPCR